MSSASGAPFLAESSRGLIRLATCEDIAYLPDIERSAGRLFLTIPDLAWIASDSVMTVEAHKGCILRGHCWVAEVPALGLVGFISAEAFGPDLHIWEISVHADGQGQGFGRRLIETVKDYAQESGFTSLTLTTFRDVGWNAPYYKRLGFETVSTNCLNVRLRFVLENEIASGLPDERRCAMRLTLD